MVKECVNREGSMVHGEQVSGYIKKLISQPLAEIYLVPKSSEMAENQVAVSFFPLIVNLGQTVAERALGPKLVVKKTSFRSN